jgi:predicted flavoprotein YhiN
LEGLEGLSVEKVKVRALNTKLNTDGPLLITHWGMSGPAILKLSAWGARKPFADCNYRIFHRS